MAIGSLKQNSLTFPRLLAQNKIPWLFPDHYFPLFSLFSRPCGNPAGRAVSEWVSDDDIERLRRIFQRPGQYQKTLKLIWKFFFGKISLYLSWIWLSDPFMWPVFKLVLLNKYSKCGGSKCIVWLHGLTKEYAKRLVGSAYIILLTHNAHNDITIIKPCILCRWYNH